jgi:ParB family chromosome partitioning protein
METATRSTMGPEPVTEIAVENIDDLQAQVPLSPEDQLGVEELARRIEKMGLLQPIVVRRIAGGRVELVAGRFRFLACKHLGWKVIPAIVRGGRLPSMDSLEGRE